MEDVYPKQPIQNLEPASPEQNNYNLPHKPHHFLTKKVAVLIIIFLLISLFSLAGAFYVLQTQRQSQTPPTSNVQNNSQQTPTPSSKPVSKNPLYTSIYNWQINYPSSLQMRELKPEELQSGILEQINFSAVGKTQAEGTEFFDGLSFNISVAQKETTESLHSFADRMSQQNTEIATRDYFKTITINGMQGYEAQVTGMGTFINIFLPRGNDLNTVIWITYMSVGPDKTMYDQMVEDMLETFTVKDMEQKACTLEAKLCSDGSSVGRQGPNCEFAACPTN